MAIAFRRVSHPPLDELSVSAPEGAVIGIIGEDYSGKGVLLKLAAGLEAPAAGEVSTRGSCRLLGPADELDLSAVDILLLDHALATRDALVRAQAAIELERLKRAGSTVLLVSHDEDLLGSACDEVWWLHDGGLAAQGDPAEVLAEYRRHVLRRMRGWGEQSPSPLAPAMRRGDGRAELVAVETLNAEGAPARVWRSGEQASVRVTVRYREPVEDPVVGIMLRTRIGMEVYGTNTELERVKLGPCPAGETLRVLFTFRCGLCPREYTITAASHDPDGVWHDWMEDAVDVLVADTRYTAGVADLRASVMVERNA
jgi:lipopolysaccharide transport system ATP-binding protein